MLARWMSGVSSLRNDGMGLVSKLFGLNPTLETTCKTLFCKSPSGLPGMKSCGASGCGRPAVSEKAPYEGESRGTLPSASADSGAPTYWSSV